MSKSLLNTLVFTLLLSASAHALSTRLLIAPMGEAAGDNLGWSVANAGDVNGDGFPDLIVGALANDAGGDNAGRVYVYFGGPNLDANPDLTLTGEQGGDNFGQRVSGGGDLNGDGFDDFVVGANRYTMFFFPEVGRAYVYYGGPGLDNTADLILDGEATGDNFGGSVTGAGDINGDGYDDLIVDAKASDAPGFDAGRVYVYFGGPAIDTTADLILDGEAAEDFFGFSIAGPGDVNGDGFDDILVGAASNDSSGNLAGRAYVYFGGMNPDSLADVTLDGEAVGDQLGWSVSGAGDVNGDGHADFLVGGVRNDAGGNNAGRAYIHYGGPGLDDVVDLTLTGDAATDQFGWSVAGAGDVNSDGFADVVVGAPTNDSGGDDRGRAYVFFGGATADSTADLILTGQAAGDRFGISVSTAGDLEDDGFADLIIGANANDAADSTSGRAYVYDQFQYILTSPNGGEVWPVGSLQTITWLGRDQADISLSPDGGGTYVELRERIGGLEDNQVTLRVPHLPSRFATIRLRPSDTSLIGQDQSDSLFTIEASISLLNLKVSPRTEGGAELAWSTSPAVGSGGISGYRLYRTDGSPIDHDTGAQIGPSLITTTTFLDPDGVLGSIYRLTAINGLGQELELGRKVLTPLAALAAWPLPYGGGELQMSFAAAGGRGGGTGSAELALYDLKGQLVRTIVHGTYEAGHHTATWDGRDAAGRPVSSGVYFLQAISGGERTQIKLVVLR